MCLASGNHGNQSDGKYDKSCHVHKCENSVTGEDFVQPFEGTKDPAFIFVEPPDLEVKKERKNFKDIRSQKHINLKLAKMLVDSYPSPKVLNLKEGLLSKSLKTPFSSEVPHTPSCKPKGCDPGGSIVSNTTQR